MNIINICKTSGNVNLFESLLKIALNKVTFSSKVAEYAGGESLPVIYGSLNFEEEFTTEKCNEIISV